MITIEITQDAVTKEYSFPNSWKDVTVAQFKDFNRGIRTGSDIETIIEVASLFSGIPEATLWEFPQETLHQLTDALAFITQPIDLEPVDRLIIGEEEYWVKKDFSQLTIGEVRALEELTVDPVGNLNWLLTVLLRRKKEGKWESVTPELLEESDKFDSVIIGDVYRLLESFQNGVTR